MRNKGLKILTQIMLTVTLTIAVLLGLVLTYFIINIKIIYPIVAIFMFLLVFILLSIHYLKGCFHLFNLRTPDSKKAKNMEGVNLFFATVFGFTAFSMITILLVTALWLRVYFEFQWYFLAVAITSSLYTINLAGLNKAFHQ